MLIFFVAVPVTSADRRGRGLLVRWVAVSASATATAPPGRSSAGLAPGSDRDRCRAARSRARIRPRPPVVYRRRLHLRGLALVASAKPQHRPILSFLGRGVPTPAIGGPGKDEAVQEAVTGPAPAFIATIPSLTADPSTNSLSAKTSLHTLDVTSSIEQTSNWLQSRRFGAYLNTFANFSVTDLLRLTRDDLIQICGMADGIRLFNALHSKRAAPRLTLYVNIGGQSDIFHALYLDQLKSCEVARGLASLLGIGMDQIAQILLQGPGGIRVVVTDDVVQVMKNEGAFNVGRLPDSSGERSCLLMTPISM